MIEVGISEAKANLSRLLQRVVAGDEVVITRDGEPVAKLVPAEPVSKRVLGQDRGAYTVSADFDDPLPEEQQRVLGFGDVRLDVSAARGERCAT